MRTSNKILLGVFLLILVILTAINGAIYAKYKSNDFTTSARLHEERYNRYNIDGVQSVSLTGLDHVTIIPSDSVKLEIEKSGNRKVNYTFTNGELVIKGDTIITYKDGTTSRERTYEDIIIYLPYVQNIKADYCTIFIRGAKDTARSTEVRAALADTELQMGETEREDTLSNNFSSIVLSKVRGGTVSISNRAHVGNFEMNLESGSFTDGGASFDSLFVSADDNSSVSLTGRNISKTKFNAKP